MLFLVKLITIQEHCSACNPEICLSGGSNGIINEFLALSIFNIHLNKKEIQRAFVEPNVQNGISW